MTLTAAQLRLYLITDDSGRSPQDLCRVVGEAIEGGVTAVQFREKSQPAAYNAESFRLLREICSVRGVPLILNADLMGSFDGSENVDGIHYSARTLPLHPEAVHPVAGFSAHSVDEAMATSHHPVSFVALSCIFDSPGKTEMHPPIGLGDLNRARRVLPRQFLLALGGITPANAGRCIAEGADGVAVIRAILSQKNPTKAAEQLRQEIDAALRASGR